MRSFHRALIENPSSPAVLMRYGWNYLHAMRRLDEANAVLRRALDMDPLSPTLHTVLGLTAFAQHDYRTAAASFQRALEVRPGLWWPGYFLGAAQIFDG